MLVGVWTSTSRRSNERMVVVYHIAPVDSSVYGSPSYSKRRIEARNKQ